MANAAAVFGVTVALLLGVAYVGVRTSRGRVESGEDLVSSPNSTSQAVLVGSLVSTNLGAWVLFTPPEAGVLFGGLPAIAGYAVGAALPLLAFVPVGTRLRRLVPHGHSITEFVRARYGRRMHAVVFGVALSYMFVFLTVELTGAVAALALVAGIDPWVTALTVGVALFAYVGYGGLIASIVTDNVQLLVVLPLLVVGFVAVSFALGGVATIHERVVTSHESLLGWNLRGIRFGFLVSLGVLAGNLLNQGFWQRVYAAEDDRTLRRALVIAAVSSGPVVFLAGLFGVQAAGFGLVEGGAANTSFFQLVSATLPAWAGIVVVAVVVLLVTSTADSLLNGLASLVRFDLAMLPGRLLTEERLVTGVVITLATVIAAFQVSEIELFFVVDLLCVPLVVPVVAGLYAERITERAALLGAASGMVVGLALDPWLRSLAVPAGIDAVLPEPTFLGAFTGAIVVSFLPVAVSATTGERVVSFDDLDARIEEIDDSDRSDPIDP